MRTFTIGLVALLSSAAVAHAQRPVSFVVSGGVTVPAGDLADFHDAGFHYDASLLFNIPGFPVTLRPEFSLTQMKLKIPTNINGEDDVTKMTSLMGNLEFPLAAGLYAIAGGGIMNLSVPGAATGGTDESSSKFAFDAGAGFRFAMGSIRGFLEARIGAASYDQGKFGFEKAQYFPVTFGLVF